MATNVQRLGSVDEVTVNGNSGFVTVQANASTLVGVGGTAINRDVSVTGGHLLLSGGIDTIIQHVKVTESTVSGTNLFGNSGVVVHYQGLSSLDFFASALSNVTVAPSHPGARFTAPITIDEFSRNGVLNVTVDVDSGSGLNLQLHTDEDNIPERATLTIVASTAVGVDAAFNPHSPTTPDGTETVSFFKVLPLPAGRHRIIPIGLSSTVSYKGFNEVVLS